VLDVLFSEVESKYDRVDVLDSLLKRCMGGKLGRLEESLQAIVDKGRSGVAHDDDGSYR